MHSIIIFTSLFISIIASNAWPSEPVSIAITDLISRGIDSSKVLVLSDKLRTEFVKLSVYDVMESEQMRYILKEQGFQQSGCTSDECVVEVGQIIGVQKILSGSIGKVGQTYIITLKIIDVSTGRIEKNTDYLVNGLIDDLLLSGVTIAVNKLFGNNSEVISTVTEVKSSEGNKIPISNKYIQDMMARPFVDNYSCKLPTVTLSKNDLKEEINLLLRDKKNEAVKMKLSSHLCQLNKAASAAAFKTIIS